MEEKGSTGDLNLRFADLARLHVDMQDPKRVEENTRKLIPIIEVLIREGAIDNTTGRGFEVVEQGDINKKNQLPWGGHNRFTDEGYANQYANQLSKITKEEYEIVRKQGIRTLSPEALADAERLVRETKRAIGY